MGIRTACICRLESNAGATARSSACGERPRHNRLLPSTRGAFPGPKALPYNYAMSQIGHEMGHRWGAFVSAKVNGETILSARPLGAGCRPRLHSPTSGLRRHPPWEEASGRIISMAPTPSSTTTIMCRDGYSYLDLYLMGLISSAEVPDFFILKISCPPAKMRTVTPSSRRIERR